MSDRIETAEAQAAGDTTTRRAGRLRPSGTVGLLCVALAAIAAALVGFALYRPIPASLATAPAPSDVPLTAEELTDARSVELAATLGEESAIASPATGTVTRTDCTAGASLASGSTTFTVDKTPLINLHTATPLWRDLAFGTEGADVIALQNELARLGYDVQAGGRFDWQTWVAWDALAESLGGNTDYGMLALNRVIWMPAQKVVIASCPIRLGQPTTAGAALMALPTPVLAASVKSYPGDLVPGTRILTVGSGDATTVLPIDEHGKLTADGLTALAGTEAYAQFAQNPKDAVLQADLVLEKPVTVYPLPPAAVSMTGESSGCVAPVRGGPISVTIVASKLGRSYVAFAQKPSVATVRAVADKELSCS
ncbi:hypothetical protein OOK41_13710 [Micromonospora sp. NBC_01655]|uniref:peptidoglycan-binding domain-containing protein n=1 Tax=Micromonospora sp. NBC_01655 TaxID=2975983 RepID=UPI002252E2EF|nr:hypothetical protein [Micromonospora sp. NBC_01655]MCX4471351.1 hypothetical protein [Micromonospora sp. NBC_01655]